MYNILVVAECINKDATSEGICTSNFLNSIDSKFFQVDCLYFQLVQHEINHPSHIRSNINLIKIKNTFLDRAIQWARVIRNRLNKHFGYDLLRNRRSSRIKKALKNILLEKDYDLIFVRTVANSIASHQAILDLAKQTTLPPWLVNFNDPVPLSMMPYPYNKNQSTFTSKIKKDEALVRQTIQFASGITSPSVLLTKKFLNFYGLKKRKEEVFAFPHVYFPIAEFDYSLPLNSNKLNLVHAGSLMKERRPEYLLKALQAIAQKDELFRKQVELVFLGNIHPDHLRLFSEFPFPEMIRLINRRVPHTQTMGLLKRADVLIILEAISDESPFMPAKLAEYIGLDRLIWSLSPDASETRRILGESHPLQSRADDLGRLNSQWEWIFLKWKRHESFSLNRPDLTHYTSPDHVNKELKNATVQLNQKLQSP